MGAHRRHNPLLDEWVVVSPGRMGRPWQGAIETATPSVPPYDPSCFLCPGNERANGARNPGYAGPYVFANDFPALGPGQEAAACHGVLRSAPARGECRVLCYSPRHDLDLGRLGEEGVRAVVEAWCGQAAELEAQYDWVQVFENRGEAMGASSPHPHGQVWATSFVPTVPAREDSNQLRHWEHTGRRLLDDVFRAEDGSRTLLEEEHWVWLVPFWAAWPFETLLVARGPEARLAELSGEQRDSLARVLAEAVRRYDRLFGVPFPYSMGWHGAPPRREARHWNLHAHFFPPLLRSATVRKHMVGFELLAEAQRDLTPEEAAERLRG